MIHSIVAYGDPVLRKKANDISKDYSDLDKLIEDMFETMYASHGVGLAAPQIGKSIRLFVIDTESVLKTMADDPDDDNEFKGETGMKGAFINARILNKDGVEWDYNEGCLSIPTVREDVTRPDEIIVEYLDEDFKPHKKKFSGFTGRVIQHEYDHIEGILFTDHLKPLKKRLLKSKLDKISRGEVKVDYKMRFPLVKR
jgi:peptide deformylase